MADACWDWNKKVPYWDWVDLQIAGFPGWELQPGKDHPHFVDLEITKGRDRSSREVAAEWDDLAKSAFYYHDWTDDGLPFVSNGETYRSGFWFATRADRDAFRARYKGEV